MRLIANEKFPYGRRALVAGDKFDSASDEDARILKGIGKARDDKSRVAPSAEPAPQPSLQQGNHAVSTDQSQHGAGAGDSSSEDLSALRAEYQRLKGSPPDGRWNARRLRNEIAAATQSPGEYGRRDMRAQD